MSLFKRKKSKAKGLLCLSFTPNGVAIAVTLDPSESASLSHIGFIPESNSSAQFESLKHYLDKQGLNDLPCHVVLRPSDYRLVQIDAPDVNDETLSSSALWLVKDLIDFSAAEAAVDAFFVPVRAGQKARALAVVARLPELLQLRASLEDIGLNLMSINIAELALRNLLYQKEEAQKSLALLYLDEDHIQILVMQSGVIGLIRRLSTTLVAEQDEQFKSQFVLEIQRSLDFYQTQQAKPSPRKIYLTPNIMHGMPWLADELHTQLALEANLLALDDLTVSSPLTEDLQRHCLTAIGETQSAQFELSTQEEGE